MSLVHEALEKAAREKQRKTGFSGSAVPAKSPSSEKPLGETPKPLTTSPASVSAPAPAPAPKTSQALLTIVISCVGLVAMVAIVYLVIRATTTTPPAPAPDGGARSGATVPAESGLGVPAKIPPPANPAPAASTGETPVPLPPPVDTTVYKLSGIMKDPEGKYCAVLNGRVVYEQHYVEGATIKKIERDRVTLDINGRETVLRLF